MEPQLTCLVVLKVNKTILKVNGSTTLPENIADIGAVQLAYQMYKKAAQKLPKDLSLPGLSQYTQKQQFWLGVAQFFCGKQPEASAAQSVTGEDIHSPWEYRVVGPLSQSQDFSRDWNCPPGAAMSPVKRCGLW